MILFATHVSCIFINLVAIKFAKYKFAREVGIWAYDEDHLGTLGIETMKLYLESYFDLAICVFINIDAFSQKPEELGDFFTRSKSDTMCSVLTVFYG